MEISIYITANIIYLVRDLYLGDRTGSFSLLEQWVIAAFFVGRHFPSALWPLAGDVWRITCSFIALALDVHVFCLRAEAEGAILHTTKMVWGMRISCGRGQCVFVASPRRLCRKFVLQNVGGTEWVRSKKLFGGGCNWHVLHESSYMYCYFKVYTGTRNLNHTVNHKCIQSSDGDKKRAQIEWNIF